MNRKRSKERLSFVVVGLGFCCRHIQYTLFMHASSIIHVLTNYIYAWSNENELCIIVLFDLPQLIKFKKETDGR